MIQVSQQDYAAFCGFIDEFSLHLIACDVSALATVKLVHGKYLALLAAWGEMLSESGAVAEAFSQAYGNIGKDYLREVGSDCSEFVMCALIGLYRSAGGTLRSSIESYMKALSAKEQPEILKRTSVPDVFADAAKASFFSTKVGKQVISELRGVYNDLNAYVHTVSAAQMFAVGAVGGFPRWSGASAELVDLFSRVVRLFLYGILGSRRDLFDQFDYRNKVIVNRALTRVQRRAALGVDD